MRPEGIPRRQERLILANATHEFDRLLVQRFFNVDKMAAFVELSFIMRVVWQATLMGQTITAQQIAHTIGMPRTTVLRKLGYLSLLGHIEHDGSAYVISDRTLSTVTPLLDRAIKLIIHTADALRAVQDG